MCGPARNGDDVRMSTSAEDPAAGHPPAMAGPARGDVERRSARWWVAAVAAGSFGIEMAVSARYGYDRDELYFLAAGHHPAFGYVDQPPLTPLLARVTAAATGSTLAGFRILPALVLAALVVVTAAMSRQLGANRAGQVLAALATATCGEYLGALHELTTTTPDFLFWAVTLYLVVRLLAGRDPRWWLAAGACAGIGFEAKWNIGFLVLALTAGFGITSLLDPGVRPLLRSRYLVLGLLLAVAIAAPSVGWQAAHGWPQLDVFHALQGQAGHNRATYWVAQILYTGPALTPIWVAGVVWSLRNRDARAFRPVALASVIVIVLQFVLGGKPYYSGAVYTFLFAAGSVPIGRWVAARTSRAGRAWPGAVILLAAAIALPISLPVLPARALHTVPLQKINYDLAETISWPQQVALVGRLYGVLPAPERARTTVLTGNYGEAGAIERYGSQFGVPTAYSGANNFWLWGPPPAADTGAIAVNVDPGLLRREFTHVRQVATFWNGLGVSDDEQGVPVYLATGLKSSWARAWPAFRHYG
jgi:hypothetical protein